MVAETPELTVLYPAALSDWDTAKQEVLRRFTVKAESVNSVVLRLQRLGAQHNGQVGLNDAVNEALGAAGDLSEFGVEEASYFSDANSQRDWICVLLSLVGNSIEVVAAFQEEFGDRAHAGFLFAKR